RPRPQLERYLGDDAQGAQGADVQLAQVVAGNVLDDAAARPGFVPLVVDHADADDVVAQGAVAVAARPTGVGGQDAAEGGPVGVRHVDGQALIFRGEQGLQAGDGNAGLDGDRHVAGGVVDDLVQAAQVHGETGPGGRLPEAEHGAAADGVDGLAGGGG